MLLREDGTSQLDLCAPLPQPSAVFAWWQLIAKMRQELESGEWEADTYEVSRRASSLTLEADYQQTSTGYEVRHAHYSPSRMRTMCRPHASINFRFLLTNVPPHGRRKLRISKGVNTTQQATLMALRKFI